MSFARKIRRAMVKETLKQNSIPHTAVSALWKELQKKEREDDGGDKKGGADVRGSIGHAGRPS